MSEDGDALDVGTLLVLADIKSTLEYHYVLFWGGKMKSVRDVTEQKKPVKMQAVVDVIWGSFTFSTIWN